MMQRFKQPGMDLNPDGEWVRYTDHIDAMRIAGAALAPAALSGSDIARIYHEATGQHLRSQDEYLAFAFTRAILAAALPAEAMRIAGEGREPVARLHITETDEWPDIRVEVLNGENLQPSMSPVDVYAAPPESRQRVASGEPLTMWRAICEEAECIVNSGKKYLMLTEEMCVRLGIAIEDAAPAPAAPEGWQPITGPGQVRIGDKLRFVIGDDHYNETVRDLIDPGTDREEIIYNIRRNYYLITSMAMANKGSQKNVRFLRTAPPPSGT